MTDVPFFSVVVPTRNRTEYLTDAVLSILQQTFGDFELIVSDNSDEKHASRNREMLASVAPDSKVRYVRASGELPVVAHWEWALNHARGRYYGLVPDRRSLRLYALDLVHEVLENTPIDIICYGGEIATEAPGYRALRPIRRPRSAIDIRSVDILASFARADMRKDTPKMLDTFVSASLYRHIQRKYGRMFTGIAQDHSFLFRMMDEVDTYCYIPLNLLVSQGSIESTGGGLRTASPNSGSTNFVSKATSEQREWLRYGPIRGDISLVPNILMREYSIAAEQSKTGKFKPVDLQKFYDHTARGALHLASKGTLTDQTARALEEFRIQYGLTPLAFSSPVFHARRIVQRTRSAFKRIGLPKPLQNAKLRLAVDMALRVLRVSRTVSSPRLIDTLRFDFERTPWIRVRPAARSDFKTEKH